MDNNQEPQQEIDNENNITDPNLLNVFDGFRALWGVDGVPCSANQAMYNILVVFDILAKRDDLADEIGKELALVGTPQGVDGNLEPKEMEKLEDLTVEKAAEKKEGEDVIEDNNQPPAESGGNEEDVIIEKILQSVPNSSKESLIAFLQQDGVEKLSDEEFLNEYAKFSSETGKANSDKDAEIKKASILVKASSSGDKKQKKKGQKANNTREWLNNIK